MRSGKAHTRTRSARVPQTELNKLESHRGLVTRCYQTYDATNASSNGATVHYHNYRSERFNRSLQSGASRPKPSRHPTAPERFSSEGPYRHPLPIIID